MVQVAHMEPDLYNEPADTPARWLAARAAEMFADDPGAAEAWLHRPRKDLAGFTPAQCAEMGGPPLRRATALLSGERPTSATLLGSRPSDRGRREAQLSA